MFLSSRKWDWSSMNVIGIDSKVPSLRDLSDNSLCLLRRLKPTVNKVLSLWDISPLSQHFYFRHNMRLFYLRFPICEKLSHKLSWSHNHQQSN